MDATEVWLKMLVADFACELANQAIQSDAVTYPSSAAAMVGMVRQAYDKGRHDQAQADAPEPDFDVDVAAVHQTNARHGAS